jgi:hypothetical protein
MATKKGRKQRHYVSSTGETIVGLSRLTDGRWRIIGTQIRFSESDERKAIERFRRLGDSPDARWKRINDLQRTEWLGEQPNFTNAELWLYVADEIRTRPEYVAEQTGIEQIG